MKDNYIISGKTLKRVVECLKEHRYILDDDGCDEINDYDVINTIDELEKEMALTLDKNHEFRNNS